MQTSGRKPNKHVDQDELDQDIYSDQDVAVSAPKDSDDHCEYEIRDANGETKAHKIDQGMIEILDTYTTPVG